MLEKSFGNRFSELSCFDTEGITAVFPITPEPVSLKNAI